MTQNSSKKNSTSIVPALIGIIAAMLLVMMDTTIMNVAIPKLQGAFHTDLSKMQWSITGYTLALAAIIPLAGYFSDRFSNKKMMLFSIIGFTVSSFLCSLADTTNQLIFFRVLQGLTGGMIAPIGMALIFAMAPPEKRGSIMGILGIPVLISPILGPIFSGFVLDYITWKWIFLLNVPIGIIAYFICLKVLPKEIGKKESKLDIIGAILSPIAFVGIIYSINHGSDNSFTDVGTLIPLLISVIALILFIFRELKAKDPIIVISAFKSKEFSKGYIVQQLNQFTVFGAMFLIPIFLQNAKGLSSLESGFAMMPQAVITFIGVIIGGRLLDKFGAKSSVLPGIIFEIISIISMIALDSSSSLILWIMTFCLLGLGQGLVQMQIGTHIMEAAPPKTINRITPLTNTSMQLFNSISIAIISSIYSNSMKNNALMTSFDHTFYLLLGVAIVGCLGATLLSSKKAKTTN
ncbi:DHA2 family efflux MFS transporter permease subunit [Staphylococcus gallinarum]|uniref:DHA2 family efflux MFS transporter permease subunit n=1 Tax=Staphylococcus gallinarum TaxID=1293 RepID=UPI001E290BEB|nr:DHA2 family efflux MFS transporter permease subunit [Staphylococcus gallinarum]MCD8920948.1 DHA2 family efflux MFS transporter permease subunit [Staphylococcus gallinarum]MEB6277562.1 DHA2 family efflux MFS transporter permease subunit [Staphylococcus gallinarum]UEH01041.1 DHA2 family efflux MFS transporter permease subunit [Staphylococcus gallinarum]